MSVSPKTKLTAVIGNPVSQSLSPFLHNKIYEDEGIDAVMLAFGNPSIEKLVAAIRALPIHLAAVTMPHKQTIMPLLDEIDATARDIGAVNTVVNRDGELRGFNTDIVGIAEALKGVPLRGANVLLIGAGGAGIFCTNRDKAQAEELMRVFGGSFVETADLGKTSFDIVINATPVGMRPNTDATPFPEEFIAPGSSVFDVVYSPLETKLLASARKRGARAVSGLKMFLAQGVEQERLWLEKKIESAQYMELLEDAVRKRDG